MRKRIFLDKPFEILLDFLKGVHAPITLDIALLDTCLLENARQRTERNIFRMISDRNAPLSFGVIKDIVASGCVIEREAVPPQYTDKFRGRETRQFRHEATP